MLNKVFNTLLVLIALVVAFLVFQPEPPAVTDIAAVPVVANPPQKQKPGVDMKLKQLAENVYYVQGLAGPATFNQGFISNAGVIITSEGVVVLDALGTPELARQLLGLIREKTDLPVKYVIVTHYHADHIYGLQVFKDQGAGVIGPEGAAAYLNADNADARLAERRISLYPWVDENTRLVAPDLTISDAQTYKLGGMEFDLKHMGAIHSDGDMTLTVKPSNVLFTGDLIFEGRIPFVGDADTKQWLITLAKLQSSQPVALVPGHGPDAKNPTKSLKFTREYIAYLRDNLGAAVDEFIPFDEAYDAIDWSMYEGMPAFNEAHRANAYQVYLALEQESM